MLCSVASGAASVTLTVYASSKLLVQIIQRKSVGGWCAHSLALIHIELMVTLYKCCARHGTNLLATFEGHRLSKQLRTTFMMDYRLSCRQA